MRDEPKKIELQNPDMLKHDSRENECQAETQSCKAEKRSCKAETRNCKAEMQRNEMKSLPPCKSKMKLLSANLKGSRSALGCKLLQV